MKPVLFVTGHAPPDRHLPFRLLHERVGIELALFGGRHAHGAPESELAGVPHRRVDQREVGRLAASGNYRAVIAGTGGRLALPGAWRGARRAGVPFVFWAALWRQPRTPAHIAAYPLMLRIYSRAAAVVTYGEHVSAYVAARGARNIQIAPQAVDNEFWRGGAARRAEGPFRALFVGREERAKGLDVLLDAWRTAALEGASLTLVGRLGRRALPPGVVLAGAADRSALRNFYAASDVLVIPSIRTRGFIEPWGLVANEAMNQGTAIIATDAVGAAAGGLVRERRNGRVVPAGDAAALASALCELAADRGGTRELGAAGRRDVAAFTPEAWAAGFAAALRNVEAPGDGLLAWRP